MAAPMKNSNAVGHGLHSKTPAKKVVVLPSVGPLDLAEYSADLRDWAMWVADELAAQLPVSHKDAGMAGLYASVSSEHAQAVAEILGEIGIKPSNLGRLDDARFAQLMAHQAHALGLILSQVASAVQFLRVHEEFKPGAGEIGSAKGVVIDGGANPVLKDLARQMRAAGRLMREMASNLAWQRKGLEGSSNVGERILEMLEGEE